jgi:Rrf2 family protein
MVVLTESEGRPVTSERIATQTSVPADYSVKVLQMLARAQLVRAQRGRGGGFKLICDPDATTLLDIVNAIDPIERITACPLGREEHAGRLCALHQRLDDLTALLQESLGRMTLRSVAQDVTGSALCEPPAPSIVTTSATKTV